LVRFGARDYDAVVGRWTSADLLLFGGGDPNLFAYVGGDPINYVDPTGLARFLFDRSAGTLTLYNDVGELIRTVVASNRAKRPNADPWLPEGNGPIPTGTFPIFAFKKTAKHPHGIFRIDLGPRTGVGVHGDAELNALCVTNAERGVRPLNQCGTEGCIRVDTSSIEWFADYHNTVEAITSITVVDGTPRARIVSWAGGM